MKNFEYLIFVISICIVFAMGASHISNSEARKIEFRKNTELWKENVISEVKSRNKLNNGCINVSDSDSLYAIRTVLDQGYCIQRGNH